MYEYRATLLRVVDGDTVHLEVDLGLDVRLQIGTRLAGIDAPELNTLAGKASRDYLRLLIPPGTPVTVRTEKDRREKYGRYLVWITMLDGVDVNGLLVAEGHARPYDGGAR